MSATFDDGPIQTGGKDDRLLSWDQVEHIASISRSTAWRMERDGAFPQRVRVSPGRVGWWESELTMWKQTRSGELPSPPSRKAARAPRLPGMARPMPNPQSTASKDPPGHTIPDLNAPRPVAAAPARKGRQKPQGSIDQIDFGF